MLRGTRSRHPERAPAILERGKFRTFAPTLASSVPRPASSGSIAVSLRVDCASREAQIDSLACSPLFTPKRKVRQSRQHSRAGFQSHGADPKGGPSRCQFLPFHSSFVNGLWEGFF